MDIYDYLKMDHKKVDKLFDLYEKAETDWNKLEIIEMINVELTLHAESEAETFYKALEGHAKSQKEVMHGEKEHEEIKEKLREVAKVSDINKTVDKKMVELRKLVKHHVSDEEGKIFDAAKKVLSEEEAYALKEQMHYVKFKLVKSMQDEIEKKFEKETRS